MDLSDKLKTYRPIVAGYYKWNGRFWRLRFCLHFVRYNLHSTVSLGAEKTINRNE